MPITSFLQDTLQHLITDFDVQGLQHIQDLWKGYGQVYRYENEANHRVIKHYHWSQLPRAKTPAEAFAIERKITSFKNEVAWYAEKPLGASFQAFPATYGHAVGKDEIVLVMQDIGSLGYDCHRSTIPPTEISNTLKLLAQLHAAGLQAPLPQQWGGYWHLATRPYEWENMPSGPIKRHAKPLQQTLQNCPYITVLHGDAKPANYGVHQTTGAVVAYDFQYWGRGVGSQDVACYLFGVASNAESWNYYTARYFEFLDNALEAHPQKEQVITAWRALMPICRLDYYRFLLGWNPQHKKLANYHWEWDKHVLD